LRVPAGAGLGDAGAGRVVDVDRAEPLAVAVGPLEVVQHRPQEVAAHVGAVLDGPVDGGQVAAHVGDPGGVVDPALGVGVVVEGRAVLRDDQRRPREGRRQAAQQVVQAGRVDGPAHGGGLAGRLVEGDPVGTRPGAVGAVAVAVGGVGPAAVGLGDDGGR